MPFEVKKDMLLAPANRRKELNSESKEKLDEWLQSQVSCVFMQIQFSFCWNKMQDFSVCQ